MNYLDALLLSNLTLLCFMALAGSKMLLPAKTLFLAPLSILILTIAFRVFYPCVNRCISKYTCVNRKRRALTFATIVDTTAASQPLIQPTHTEVSYGINDNDIPSPREEINHN